MRTILGMSLTFVSALFVVAVAASVLEIWATSRGQGESDLQVAEAGQPARPMVLSGFFPRSARH